MEVHKFHYSFLYLASSLLLKLLLLLITFTIRNYPISFSIIESGMLLKLQKVRKNKIIVIETFNIRFAFKFFRSLNVFIISVIHRISKVEHTTRIIIINRIFFVIYFYLKFFFRLLMFAVSFNQDIQKCPIKILFLQRSTCHIFL